MRRRAVANFLMIFMLLMGLAAKPAAVQGAVQAGPRSYSAVSDAGYQVIADFETGLPSGFGGFADSWDGTGSSTTLAASAEAIDLPMLPAISGNKAVKVIYNIAASGGWGGGPGYGGVTHDFSAYQDWSAYTEFSLMFYGSNTGGSFRLELKSDGASAGASNRFVYTFTDNFTGWKYIEVPFSSFINRTDYTPGPAPTAPMNLLEMWGYSLLLPGGVSGTVYLDRVAISGHQLVASFDTGLPTGFAGFADSFDGSGSSTMLSVSNDTAAITMLPANADNKVVSVTYSIAAAGGWGGGPGYGGITQAYSSTANWSLAQSFNMWFMGGGTGAALRIELKSDGPGDASSNRYVYGFTDDFNGWKLINVPWSQFSARSVYDYNPGPSPSDPINLAKIWGYSILIPGGVSGSFKMDQVNLYGNTPVQVGFSSATYSVTEGDSASISATLNHTAAQVVTVDYATADATGVAGVDYTAASGTLTFQPGDLTKTFTVQTTPDSLAEDNKTISLSLSNAANATLSSISTAVLTMLDTTGPANVLADPYVNIVDDYEYSSGLPYAVDSFNNSVGYVTWGGPSNSASPTLSLTSVTSSGDTLAVPGLDLPDQVLKISFNIPSGGWGGFTHAFEQGLGWVSQNWYQYSGISFWLYGTKSGGDVNVDIFDNKSTSGDSAERYTYIFKDDFSGWKYFQVPWASFTRKSWQPSGAPSDGLTLTEVWGYGFGFPANTGATTMYLDNFSLMVRHSDVDVFEGGLPAPTDSYGNSIGFVAWGGPIGSNIPTISTTSVTDSADSLYIPYIGVPNTLLKVVYDISSGGWGGFTHAFQDVSTWKSQDWSTYEGISFFIYGRNTGADIVLDVIDNKSTTGDSGERYTASFADNFSGWKFKMIPFSAFTRKGYQPDGAPNDGFTKTEVWGYAFGFPGNVGSQTTYIDHVAVYGNIQSPSVTLAAKFDQYGYSAVEGNSAAVGVKLTTTSASTVTVDYSVTGGTALALRDYEAIGGTLTFLPGETTKTITVNTIQDTVYEGDETINLTLSNPSTGTVLGNIYSVVLTIIDNDVYIPNLLDDLELPTSMYRFTPGSSAVTRTQRDVTSGDPLAVPGQDAVNTILEVDVAASTTAPNSPLAANALERQFGQSADWTNYGGLNFWYYGNNSGKNITVILKDNRASDPGPTGWVQVWGDEFNDAAGTQPDPNRWGYNLGGQGWGNNELEYYTSNAENASMDGSGNLAIVAREIADPATSGLTCHYGPCQYTSARLVTANRFDFAYGRAEARMKLPYGQGMWPAFWMLGYQNDQLGWPNSGEVDIMENVGKIPGTVYGTVHGPGYSGGNGIGGSYTLANSAAFSDAFHVFAIEWEPNVIRWYVDGTQFFTVTPADLPAGKQWVFDHPFSLLLNLAVGGGWPGSPDGTTVFPQTMLVDYVRIYQAADTSERFTYTFTDNFTGWKKVMAPFRMFERSSTQPANAPDDGLTLKEVWGFGLEFPTSSSAQVFYLDQFQLSKQIIMPLVFMNSTPK